MPDMPDNEAGRLVKETLHRLFDFRGHVQQQVENHRQLLKFWETQQEIVDAFLTRDQLDRERAEITTPERERPVSWRDMDEVERREFL